MIDVPLLLILNKKDLEIKYSDYIIASRKIEGKRIGLAIKGPTERLIDRLGLLTLAKYAVNDKNTVEGAFNRELASILREISEIRRERHLDFILITDDAASYGGPLLPKWYMEELYIPSHEKISKEIRRLGAEAFLHSDGDYGPYFEYLGATWDALHPLDIYPRGSLQEYRAWLNRLMRIRRSIECRIATGIPLEMNDEEEIVAAVELLVNTHGREGLILSNYHPPISELDLKSVLEGVLNVLYRN